MQATFRDGDPPELLLYDEQEPCPYLPTETARLPMRLPLRSLTPSETDAHLAEGDRRHGRLLYRTACPKCKACEPLRIDVDALVMSRTQRRIKRRGDRVIELEIGRPTYTAERLELYTRHKVGRSLDRENGRPLDDAGYRSFLVDSCVESIELRYRIEGKLVAVAIADKGASSLSAVYCFYDPEYPSLSLGTYSILKQVELCKTWGLRHLYLGLFIGANEHMRYKARFGPHERLARGEWSTHPRSEE
jgi:arginyl-tRNA--protein-N-Asp/Glu arginylyltransferase